VLTRFKSPFFISVASTLAPVVRRFSRRMWLTSWTTNSSGNSSKVSSVYWPKLSNTIRLIRRDPSISSGMTIKVCNENLPNHHCLKRNQWILLMSCVIFVFLVHLRNKVANIFQDLLNVVSAISKVPAVHLSSELMLQPNPIAFILLSVKWAMTTVTVNHHLLFEKQLCNGQLNKTSSRAQWRCNVSSAVKTLFSQTRQTLAFYPAELTSPNPHIR
jgi:hypothetical protein